MTTSSGASVRPYSDLAIPPGEFLEEELAELGMTQQDLARRTGRPVQVINEIIRGKKAITQDTALELESVLGIPAHLWTALEADYQLTRARLRKEEEFAGQAEWPGDFPVQEMERLGWIPGSSSAADQVRSLLHFFGVSSIAAYRATAPAASFDITPGPGVAEGALNAWLRKGEIESRGINTDRFVGSAFRDVIRSIRALARTPAPVVVGEMQRLCAAAGVAFVVIEPLPQMGASGCVRWLNAHKALIQLSTRALSDDRLWFEFFHACAHVLRHQVRGVFVEGLSADLALEHEADAFARDLIVGRSAWEQFIARRQFSPAEVLAFAEEAGVTPGVVVGRLQEERRVPLASELNRLKTRLQ